MSDNLVIAVPSKGRLQENTADFFKRAGFKLTQPGGDRNYRGLLSGLENAEIAFLSASEIAREVAAGHVHLGVTGLDLVREKIPNWHDTCHLVTPLGFGHADVVTAVSDAWIDVDTFEDLADVAAAFRAENGRPIRVATKYVALTRSYFAEHGLADYRIVESLGATEGAPAAGSAEIIVDITTTGSTLKANHLKVPTGGVILRSQAHLVASRKALWQAAAKDAARVLLDRVAADTKAQAYVEMRADFGYDPILVDQLIRDYGVEDPFGAEARPLTLLAPHRYRHQVADALRGGGASIVTVQKLDDIFSGTNPLYEALTRAL